MDLCAVLCGNFESAADANLSLAARVFEQGYGRREASPRNPTKGARDASESADAQPEMLWERRRVVARRIRPG